MALCLVARFVSRRLFLYDKPLRLLATSSEGRNLTETKDSQFGKQQKSEGASEPSEVENVGESTSVEQKLPPLDLTNLVKGRHPKDTAVYKEFQRRFEEFEASFKTEHRPVNFEELRRKVRFLPYLVDELQTLYENFEPPPLDNLVKELVREVDDYYQKLIQESIEIDKRIAVRNRLRRETKRKIQYIQDNIETITVDEYLELFPKLKKQIEEDIKERRWLKGIDL
ncbi:hypothetical protein Gasu2_20520 [Galdieria sulphuraria]|uniref:F-type H+-transporting ATPase subunit d n=1 Tax=Galdieria sulphuraria TaxID=130081 RepID=M2XM57_GALSU|nr:F-type H+-transporting ATPase subunit d [Galdieria sulphuraria]EME31282.1 F-type H+-transporting ATPase subunit d [Galdieria sulphuraria]GJD07709.1 hypothetical protein Gasu2_20520 [Galdieria sulphuraria]|eukprot:XP_005707802.1 F-type H+-transporting ATPase subunit d [Galdieria sulphuraria]